MAGKSLLTIRGHLVETIAVLRNAKTPSYHPHGHFLLSNLVGMGLTIDMLTKLRVAKRRIVSYVQYSTIQKLCSTYATELGIVTGRSA